MRQTIPATGFVYPRVPNVSAAILAYDLDVDPIYLVDQPIKSKQPGLRRVSSRVHRRDPLAASLPHDRRSVGRRREETSPSTRRRRRSNHRGALRPKAFASGTVSTFASKTSRRPKATKC